MQSHDASRAGRPDDDVLEFLDIGQTPESRDLQSERRISDRGRSTDFSGDGLLVLTLDGRLDLIDADIHRSHLVRIQPDSNGVFPKTEVVDRSDAGDTCQRVRDMDVRIVGQIAAI